MEYIMTGRVMQPRGNYDPTMAPYGNYPCEGEDRWVSIAIATDEEWQGLKAALGSPAWTSDPKFASRYGRLKHRHELDQNLAQWTAGRSAETVTELLQSHGVAAVPVMGPRNACSTPTFGSGVCTPTSTIPRWGRSPSLT